MSYCLKVLVFGFCFLVLLGGISAQVLAQETTSSQEAISSQEQTAPTGTVDATGSAEAIEETGAVQESANELVDLDENVFPKDLGVGEPNLLPDSRFYFLKDLGRGISSFFTFNPVAKAELKLKFTNEKLMEAKKLAEKTNNPELLKKAINNFQEEWNELKQAVQKIKQGAENSKTNQFVDKFIEQGLKQQKFLGKFENDLPAEVHQDLMLVKEKTLSDFSDINLKLVSPKIFAEKINKIINEQTGSGFRQFKNLEVLNDLKQKVPETAKSAIEQAIDNSMVNLKENMEKMDVKEREKFKNYLSSLGGNEAEHLSVIDQLESGDITTELRKDIESAKEKVFEKIENRLENYEKKNLDGTGKKLLESLNTGEIGDLRVIKELENNLSSELAPKILQIKKTAKEKLIKTFEKIETPEDQKKIFDEIESKFSDVKQLEVFKEIEKIIPQGKQEFFGTMKEKVIQGIKKEIKEAKRMPASTQKRVLEKMAGGSAEGIKILQEYGASPELVREITKEIKEKSDAAAAKCPSLVSPTPDACKGKWVVEKSSAGCPIFKCLNASGGAGEILCARQGEKVNRNPLMGTANQKCCPGLFEARVSKSYSICQKENSSGIIPTEQQSPASEKPIIGMPNPASVYCQKMGYKLEIRTDSVGGQYGVCIFSDGSECEEWAFFRGECGSQYKKQDISSGGQVPSSGNPSNDMSAPSVGQACIQIITPAISPEGICKVFSTPCEVPSGWQRVQKCPSSGIIEPQSGDGTNSLSPSSQGY